MANVKELEAAQPSYSTRDCAREVGSGEVEDGEEGEVTEVRADLPLEGYTRQLQGGDAPPTAVAARDAHPEAERGGGGPVSCEDAERVGDLPLESQQSSEVGVAAVAPPACVVKSSSSGRSGQRDPQHDRYACKCHGDLEL